MNWAGLLQNVLVILHLSQMGSSTSGSFQIQVPEELDVGVKVGSLSPTFHPPYQLLTQDYLRLDPGTGDLFVGSSRLDRDALCPDRDCILPHLAMVGPSEELVQFCLVLDDINDNPPQFQSAEIQLSIPEDEKVGTRFPLDELAEDGDMAGNGEVQYHLEGAGEVFMVEQEEEVLMLVLGFPLDRETQELYHMTLVATDHGTVPLSASISLIIKVTDVNDNCPVFASDSPQTVTLPVDTPQGALVVTVRASDSDLGSNAAISYSFSPKVSLWAQQLFSLDPLSGEIHMVQKLQCDPCEDLELKVLATGPHCPPADTKVTVTLLTAARRNTEMRIRFIAQHEDHTIMLLENQPPTVLALIEVVGDQGSLEGLSSEGGGSSEGLALSLEAEDQPFSLNLVNGKYLLSTSKSLDYEERKEYVMFVVACETQLLCSEGGVHSRTQLRVAVLDVNDNTPTFLQSEYLVEVEENNQHGVFLLKVLAEDADSEPNSRLTYLLNPPTAVFKLDQWSGQLTISEQLDREQQETHCLTILARDSGTPPRETAVTVTVHVLDQNDNAPEFHTPHFIFFIPESVLLLSPVGKVAVSDADAGVNGQLEVRVLNSSGPFVMDNVQGTLRCTGTLDRERQASYEFSLIATDHGRPSQLSSFARVTVFVEDVNDNHPRVVLPSSNLSCITVSPTITTGTMVTKIFAVDEDSGMNSDITYTVAAGEPAQQNSPFGLDPRLGNVTLLRRLEDTDLRMHHLFIVVSDSGKPSPLHTTVWLNLLVNHSSERCHLDTVPSALHYSLPAQRASESALVCQGVTHARVLLLVGIGLMGASGVLLLGTMLICLKLRNMRQTGAKQQRRRRYRKEKELPLRLCEKYYSAEDQ